MREVMTKSMARNISYGGSLFFILIFVGLTAQSHLYITSTSTDKATLTDSVAAGKHLLEKHACINCHSILGEGAYFAPELGNVMTRWGVEPGDHQAAFARPKARPPRRRQIRSRRTHASTPNQIRLALPARIRDRSSGL